MKQNQTWSSALLLGVLQEAQTVADEELAADDEEQNNAGENITKGVVQAVQQTHYENLLSFKMRQMFFI